MNCLEELGSVFETVEVARCYVCDSQDLKPAYTRRFFDRDFHWARCHDCGLVFQNPKLTRSSLQAVYNSKIYWQNDERTDDGRRMGYNQYEKDDSLRLALGRSRVEVLKRYLDRGRVLEIGCATGSFVKAAVDSGFDCRGVELSQDAAEFGRSAYGIDIEVGDFDFGSDPPESYDGVAFWGCDSNFYDPSVTLGRINKILRPGGILCFNFWDFEHLLRPLLLGDNKLLYNSMVCFSRRNVEILLQRLGFEVLALKSEWRRATLDSVFAWTGHHRLLKLTRFLRLSNLPVWLPALTSFVCVARKIPSDVVSSSS